MSKKTAIQELKEYFEQQLRIQRSSEIKYTTEETLVDAIQVCQNAINTKEKEQLIAFGYAQIQEIDSELGDLIYKKVPEEIYNQTYGSQS
jgi:hypothetical protein